MGRCGIPCCGQRTASHAQTGICNARFMWWHPAVALPSAVTVLEVWEIGDFRILEVSRSFLYACSGTGRSWRQWWTRAAHERRRGSTSWTLVTPKWSRCAHGPLLAPPLVFSGAAVAALGGPSVPAPRSAESQYPRGWRDPLIAVLYFLECQILCSKRLFFFRGRAGCGRHACSQWR